MSIVESFLPQILLGLGMLDATTCNGTFCNGEGVGYRQGFCW